MPKEVIKKIVRPIWDWGWRIINKGFPTNPYITAKFIPVNGDSNSFVIAKVDRALAPSGPPGLPVPAGVEHMRHNRSGLEDFLRSGQSDAENMLKILKESGFELKKGMRVLDFGCSTCRVMRWLKDYSEICDIWGCDVHSGDIHWCKQHLSPPFNFCTTTTLPHLPFEDRSFDLIYAGSLFTHIDEQVDTWLLELRRVLKPGGFFYLTIHDNHTVEGLETKWKDHPLAIQMHDHPEYDGYVKSRYAMFTIYRSMGSQVFFDSEWFNGELGKSFEVVKTVEEAYAGYQTAIVVRRPNN